MWGDSRTQDKITRLLNKPKKKVFWLNNERPTALGLQNIALCLRVTVCHFTFIEFHCPVVAATVGLSFPVAFGFSFANNVQ